MVRFMPRFLKGVATAALAVVGTQLYVVELRANDDMLTIGSDAPALDVEHWVQNGEGKFKPVTEFEDGKVYIVEFWATWCGPCIASMPHIVDTQKKYADKGVQIVSISDEDLATVEEFLERDYTASEEEPGAKAPKTYKELTSSYCLTTDPDGSSSKDYMEAAGQNGIPCAFIVGKDQKIEWIGHPMSMDDPLAQVVEGKWDREAFATEFKESQEADLLMSRIVRMARSGDTDAAMKMVDEAAAAAKSESMKMQLVMMKVQLLMMGGKSEDAIAAMDKAIEDADDSQKQQLKTMRIQLLLSDVTNPSLPAAATEAYEDFKDQPALVNMIAWTIYEAMDDGTLSNDALLKASRAAAEKAAAAAEGSEKASILDTAAHLQFLDGDTAAAIKTQEEAIALADAQTKAQLQEFLDELKKAVEKKK